MSATESLWRQPTAYRNLLVLKHVGRVLRCDPQCPQLALGVGNLVLGICLGRNLGRYTSCRLLATLGLCKGSGEGSTRGSKAWLYSPPRYRVCSCRRPGTCAEYRGCCQTCAGHASCPRNGYRYARAWGGGDTVSQRGNSRSKEDPDRSSLVAQNSLCRSGRIVGPHGRLGRRLAG